MLIIRHLFNTSKPASSPLFRKTIMAVIFSAATLLIALIMGLLMEKEDLPWFILVTYWALYAALGLTAFHIRADLYAGFYNTIPIAAFVTFGPLTTTLTIFGGAALLEMARFIFSKRLELPRHRLREAIVTWLFDAGASGYSTLLAGCLFLVLGGRSPSSSTDPTRLLLITLMLCVRAVLFVTPTFVYAGLSFLKIDRQKARVAISHMLLVEGFSIPLVLLIVANYDANDLTNFFVMLGITLFFSSLFSATERSQQALERRLDELAALNNIGQSLASNLTLPDLMQSLYDHVYRLVNASSFYIALYDADAAALSIPFLMCNGERKTWNPRPMTNGVTEYVIRTAKPVFVNGSVESVDQQLAQMGIERFGSAAMCYIGVPLIAEQEVVGVLAVQSDTNPNAFGKSDMTLLCTIAAQAAIALRNASLYSRVYEMAEKLALLNNVSSVVTASLDLDKVLNTICDIVIEVGYAEKTGIFLLDESGATLRLAHAVGLSEDYVTLYQEIMLSAGSGPMQVMCRTEETAIANVHTDPLGVSWRRLAEIEGYSGLLTVPLIANQQTIGFLATFYRQPHPFSQGELDLMGTLANQVAVAVANARLHDDTRARAYELSRLVEASRVFTASLNLQSVATSVFDELGNLLKPDQMTIRLREQNGELTLLSEHNGQAMSTMKPTDTIMQALASGKAVMMPQSKEDREMLQLLGVQSVYVSPLISQEKAFGVVLIAYKTARTFNNRERQLIGAMVNQAAIAIRNAQLFSQVDTALDDRVTELSAIEAISRKISGALDLASIIAEVQQTAIAVTQADLSSILLVASDPEHLTMVERYNRASGLAPLTVDWRYDKGVIGRVLRTGQVARVSDVHTDPDYYPAAVPDMRSELCVPIIHNGERVGALSLESHRDAAFTASHERFLTNLAEHAAIAIGNARLFEERLRQIDMLVKVRNLSLELLSASTLREVMNLIAEYMLIIVYAKDVHLYLYDVAADTLTFGASLWMDGRVNVEASKPSRGGRTHRVARSGEMLLIPDMNKLAAEHGYAEKPNYASIARIPIKRAGQVFGVLIMTFRDPHYFTESEIRILDLVAGQTAIAIENARLFEEARAGRDRMQVIFDSTRDGMILVDRNGRVVLVNRAAEQLLAYPLNSFQGEFFLRAVVRTRHEMLDIPDRDMWMSQVRGLLAAIKKAPDQTTRRVYRIGTSDIEETTLPVHDAQGQVAGRLLVLRDVSEEQALKRFQEDVTDMLIHDLRAPLSGIISSLHLIRDLVKMDEYAEIDAVIDVALESGEMQLRRIESLRDIRKWEEGQMSLNLKAMALKSVVRKSIATLLSIANEAEIKIIDRIPDDLPAVCIDEDHLNRVLCNLLDNALRHTPGGGEVRLDAVVLEPNAEGKRMVKVSVIDTGKGIPPEFRKRVFDKFVQVPNSAVRGRRGSGLGLTFCKLTIEAHGGQIWVESGPEGGAAFSFTLPAAHENQDKDVLS